eukprot:gene8055-9465_t
MFLKDKRGSLRWAKLYTKYLKTGPYLEDFLAWNHDKTGRAEYHAALQNIKATLDVLDPTTKSSADVVFYLNYMTVFYYMSDKFKDTPVNREIIKETIAQIFNKTVAREAGDGFEPVLRDYIGAFANANAALDELQKAILKVQYSSVDRPNIKNGITAFTEAYGNMIIKQLKIKLPNFVFTNRFKYFVVSMFRCAHVVMIGYAIYNKDKMSTYQKAYFTAEGVGALIDSAVAIGDKAGTEYVKYTCTWFNQHMIEYVPAGFATRVQVGFKYLFTDDASSFILERFTPVMLLITAAKSFYDIIQDVKEGDITAFAFDGATFGVAAAGVAVFMAGISWSGPFALAAAITIALIGGIKYLVTSEDSADKTYYDQYLFKEFRMDPKSTLDMESIFRLAVDVYSFKMSTKSVIKASFPPATVPGAQVIDNYLKFRETLIDGVFIKSEDVHVRTKREISAETVSLGLRGLPDDNYDMPDFTEGQDAWTADNSITDREGCKRLSHMTLFDKAGVNVVHQRAQQYLYENILYFTDRRVRDLFKLKRPDLSKTRLEIIEPSFVAGWYYVFSPAYFALLLSGSESEYASKVNKKLVKQYIDGLFTMMDRGSLHWAKAYTKYLKTGPFLEDFLAWNHDKTGRAEYHAALQNIKATLDVLDPTTKSSKEVIFYLNYMTVFYYMSDKFKDTPVHREIIKETIAQIFNKTVAREAGDGFEPVLRDFIGAFANANAALDELQKAILKVQYSSVDRPNIKNGITAFTEAYGNKIIKQLKIKLPNFVFTNRFKYFVVSMFRCAHVVMIGYAIYYQDKMSTYQKAYFTAEGVGALIDSAVAIGDKLGTDYVQYTCTWFNIHMMEIAPAGFANRVEAGFKLLFTDDASSFILERFTPVMLLITAAKSFYDVVQDVKEGDKTALAFDAATFGVGAAGVAVFVAGISWSGPFALGASITIALLGGAKYFVTSEDSADKTFYNQYLFKEFRTDSGSTMSMDSFSGSKILPDHYRETLFLI